MPGAVFLVGFVWGLVLLGSFAGWGLLVRRLLLRETEVDWGQAIARGMAVLIAVGGVLNLLHAVSVPLLVGLVVAGVAALALLGRGSLAGCLRGPWELADLACLL